MRKTFGRNLDLILLPMASPTADFSRKLRRSQATHLWKHVRNSHRWLLTGRGRQIILCGRDSLRDYLAPPRKGNLKMKFVLKSSTDIPVCGFKFHFPSQTGMSVLPPFRATSNYRLKPVLLKVAALWPPNLTLRNSQVTK